MRSPRYLKLSESCRKGAAIVGGQGEQLRGISSLSQQLWENISVELFSSYMRHMEDYANQAMLPAAPLLNMNMCW